MKKKAFLLLTIVFFFLVAEVTADDCQGKITNLVWEIDRDDKITIDVGFENTGPKTCNYRVRLYGENDNCIGCGIGIAGWRKVKPGDSDGVEIVHDDVRDLGKSFRVKLWHVGGAVGVYFDLTVMDSSEKKEIAFDCEGKCKAGGGKEEARSYFSEADCYTALGQVCGEEAICEGKEFEECKECCEEHCEKASISDPSLGDDFEYEDEFWDGCMHECGKSCGSYYEILRIENPSTDDIRVVDPVGYTQTITVYDGDCEQISGDFTDYRVSDVPQCRATQEAVMDFELIFPEKYLQMEDEAAAASESTGKCEILDAWWDKTTATKNEQLRMKFETSTECKEYTIEYKVYLNHWWFFVPDKLMATFQGRENNVWTPVDTKTYYFKVILKEKSGKKQTKASNHIKITDCVDDALLICQGQTEDKYGVTDATRYSKIASQSLPGGKTKHWILDKSRYFDIEGKKCYDPDNDKNYEEYVLVDNLSYVDFVKEKFGKEPLFKKYEREYDDEVYAAYLYCYKTDLKDTTGCREEINYNRYSLERNFSIRLMEVIKPEYMRETKRWNYWQAVDERPHEEVLTGGEEESSKFFGGVWTKIFTLSPLLEDQRNDFKWTAVGDGSVYVGTGFERVDACRFSCDAKKERDTLEECIPVRESGAKVCGGIGRDECSTCYNNDCEEDPTDCTKSSLDPACGGDGINDCGKICKIEAYYSDEGTAATTTFTIPRVDLASLDPDIKVVEVSKNVWQLNHPAFNITERGNLEFEVKNQEFIPVGDTYTIKRQYDVKVENEEDRKKFIINSDIVFNYDLLEEAEELDIKVKHDYGIKLERKIYKVKCETSCCLPCEAGCCGFQHDVMDDGCKLDHTETESSARTVTDNIKIPKVSHSKITDTAEVSITGVIDQFVDDFDEITISGELEVTLNPDILGAFLLQAKSAGIIYRDIVYPVKHLLYKKRSSPPEDGTNTKEYDFSNGYGYEDSESFNFPEQCRKVCPDPQCECPLDDPLKPECVDYSREDEERQERDDCACLPSGCYPNPCVSERTFHEEEGSRIVNGDFEQEIGDFWKVKEGSAERELGGHSGHKLKLDGKISQEIIPAMHSQPYGKLCLEYGVESTSEFKVILTLDGEEESHPICSADSCSKLEGWKKECLEIEGDLSQVELVSDGIVYVDNVNLGKFYDFINFQTFKLSDLEYMDNKMKGWDYLGLFYTDGVVHDKNSYSFEFEVLSKRYLHPRTGEVLTYTLSPEDLLESTMDIYTFFRSETFPLFPPREEKNLYINVIMRDASRITLEYLPKSYMISPGSEVTVNLELFFFKSGEPIPDEYVYLDFLGEDIDEICDDLDASPELECLLEEGVRVVKVKTDDAGRAVFSFKPEHKMTLVANFGGNEKASPSTAWISIPILSMKSPLFSLEFLVLIIIFYLAIFSYRFFQPSRTDIYHWWEELKGKRL